MKVIHVGMTLMFLLSAFSALSAQPKRVLKEQYESVNSLSISPDNGFIAVGCSGKGEGTVLLWDFKSGELLQTWRGYTKYQQMLAFSPDSNYLAISYDKGSAAPNGWVKVKNLSKKNLHWKVTLLPICQIALVEQFCHT
jgi:WD40 repeat protein